MHISYQCLFLHAAVSCIISSLVRMEAINRNTACGMEQYHEKGLEELHDKV